MGFREFWNRLTGGDEVERVKEELEQDRTEQPEPLEDYEERKDDVAIDERFRGTSDFD
jgi:hypothetical protein